MGMKYVGHSGILIGLVHFIAGYWNTCEAGFCLFLVMQETEIRHLPVSCAPPVSIATLCYLPEIHFVIERLVTIPPVLRSDVVLGLEPWLQTLYTAHWQITHHHADDLPGSSRKSITLH